MDLNAAVCVLTDIKWEAFLMAMQIDVRKTNKQLGEAAPERILHLPRQARC